MGEVAGLLVFSTFKPVPSPRERGSVAFGREGFEAGRAVGTTDWGLIWVCGEVLGTGRGARGRVLGGLGLAGKKRPSPKGIINPYAGASKAAEARQTPS